MRFSDTRYRPTKSQPLRYSIQPAGQRLGISPIEQHGVDAASSVHDFINTLTHNNLTAAIAAYAEFTTEIKRLQDILSVILAQPVCYLFFSARSANSAVNNNRSGKRINNCEYMHLVWMPHASGLRCCPDWITFNLGRQGIYLGQKPATGLSMKPDQIDFYFFHRTPSNALRLIGRIEG